MTQMSNEELMAFYALKLNKLGVKKLNMSNLLKCRQTLNKYKDRLTYNSEDDTIELEGDIENEINKKQSTN